MAYYQRPGWLTQHVFNRAVAGLTRLGVSVAGSRVLEVRGGKSGEPRRTPVNLMTFEGRRPVAARGSAPDRTGPSRLPAQLTSRRRPVSTS